MLMRIASVATPQPELRPRSPRLRWRDGRIAYRATTTPLYTSDTCLSCHRLASETGVVEASTDQTGERPDEPPAGEVPLLSAQVQEDAETATRDGLMRRWATIIGVSAICVVVFTLLRRS
jgi:hypothetical protein